MSGLVRGESGTRDGRRELVRLSPSDTAAKKIGLFFVLSGVYGTFHHISGQHLDRYIGEFSFRWDNRDVSDFDRTIEAVKGVKGKRLFYKMPVSKG